MGRVRCFWAALGAAALAVPPAMASAAPMSYADLARLPDWSGVWQPDWSMLFPARSGANGNAGQRLAPKPALTPAAAKAAADYEAAKAKGENLQGTQANCVPPGLPGIMREPYPIEFIYSPDRVSIITETFSQVRRVYTDGRKLPDDPDPQFNGSSIGHWEGDTLVVDTIGFSPEIEILPGVHPSEQMHIQERIRLEKPGVIMDDFTITDPAVFTQPYLLKQAWIRKPGWVMREYICQENNRDAADPFGRPSLDLSMPKKN